MVSANLLINFNLIYIKIIIIIIIITIYQKVIYKIITY